MLVSVILAVVSTGLEFDGQALPDVSKISRLATVVVPSIGEISRQTSNPEASLAVLSIQWISFPIYLAALFWTWPPWSATMRSAIRSKSRNYTSAQRAGFVFVYLFICMWLLGYFSRLGLPNFLNGRLVLPREDAVAQLRGVYRSPAVLCLYAWLSPLIEACVIWLFTVFTSNFRLYLLPEDTQSEIPS
jgi:hypothetical protein